MLIESRQKITNLSLNVLNGKEVVQFTKACRLLGPKIDSKFNMESTNLTKIPSKIAINRIT